MSLSNDLDPIDSAIVAFQQGKSVVVVDADNRENEGDLIFPAQFATPELLAFMIRYTSGYICVGMDSDLCDRLNLPLMWSNSEDPRKTAYTVSVDASDGTTTGISAKDRALTIAKLADPNAQPSDFQRPGHVLPLRAEAGGVLARAGHTEASVDLARLAGLSPAGALCEIVSEEDPTTMARRDELRKWSNTHGIPMVSIEDLIEWRRIHDPRQ